MAYVKQKNSNTRSALLILAGAEGFAFVGDALQKCRDSSLDYLFESLSLSHAKSPPLGELFTWLGIKNDYRTLIGVDSLDIIEKEEDDDSEENGDV